MRAHHKLAHSQLGTLILCSSLLQWSELAMTRASTISSHFLSLTFLFGVLLCTKRADLASALYSFVVYCDCMINVLRLPDQLDLQLAIMHQIGLFSTGVFSDTCQPLGSFYFRLALPNALWVKRDPLKRLKKLKALLRHDCFYDDEVTMLSPMSPLCRRP